MNFSKEAADPSLYRAERNLGPPKSPKDQFKETVAGYASMEARWKLMGHSIMQKYKAKIYDLDENRFKQDLQDAADFVVSNHSRHDFSGDNQRLEDMVLEIAIGDNLRRAGKLDMASSKDVEEEEAVQSPLEQAKKDYTTLVVETADDQSLLSEILDDPMLSKKNIDIDELDRGTLRKNLATNATIFAVGVRGPDDVQSQARLAIVAALNKTARSKT